MKIKLEIEDFFIQIVANEEQTKKCFWKERAAMT